MEEAKKNPHIANSNIEELPTDNLQKAGWMTSNILPIVAVGMIATTILVGTVVASTNIISKNGGNGSNWNELINENGEYTIIEEINIKETSSETEVPVTITIKEDVDKEDISVFPSDDSTVPFDYTNKTITSNTSIE